MIKWQEEQEKGNLSLRVDGVFLFVACMMPYTTAANELWWEVCLWSDIDEGVIVEGTPAGQMVGDVNLLTDSFLPNTQ